MGCVGSKHLQEGFFRSRGGLPTKRKKRKKRKKGDLVKRTYSK